MSDNREFPPTPKRSRSASNEPAFLPSFPANFALDFSDWVVDRYAEDETLILDPFCGSATTLLSAQSHGVPGVGLELNPVWVVYAKSRLTAYTDTMESEMQRLLRQLTLPSGSLSEAELNHFFRRFLQGEKQTGRGALAHVAASILMCARDKFRPEYGMNHSWPRLTKEGSITITAKDLGPAIKEALTHSKWVASRCQKASHSDLVLADARGTHHLTKGATLLVTSPPYLSRLDYIRSSLPELEYLKQLDIVEDIEELRSAQIGSVIVRGDGDAYLRALPSGCRELLRRIEGHPSKASRSYYVRFVRNYLGAMRDALESISLAAAESARFVVVAQDSWYKDVLVGTSELLREILDELGWTKREQWMFKVESSLSEVNPHSRMWRDGSKVSENVTVFARGDYAS